MRELTFVVRVRFELLNDDYTAPQEPVVIPSDSSREYYKYRT